MRKLFFLLCLATLLFSCNQEFEDLELPNENQMDVISSARSTSIPGIVVPTGLANLVPPYLDQIVNIPVAIHLNSGVMDNNMDFLSTNKDNKVAMEYKDKSKYSHRWIITPGEPGWIAGDDLSNPGTSRRIKHEKTGKVISIGPDKIRPKLVPYIPSSYSDPLSSLYQQILFEEIEDGQYYIRSFNSITNTPPNLKLAALARYYSVVRFYESPEYDYLAKWNVVPIEEFEVLDIAYDFVDDGVDYFEIIDKDEQRKPINNLNGWGNLEYTFTYTEKRNRTSTMTNTQAHKQTVAISSSSTTGFQVPDMGASSSTTLNTGITTEWSTQLQFGETTSEESTIQHTYKYSVPAGFDGTMIIKTREKKACVTYIATLKGKTTGTILKTKGKWSGTVKQYHEIYALDHSGNDLDIDEYLVEATHEIIDTTRVPGDPDPEEPGTSQTFLSPNGTFNAVGDTQRFTWNGIVDSRNDKPWTVTMLGGLNPNITISHSALTNKTSLSVSAIFRNNTTGLIVDGVHVNVTYNNGSLSETAIVFLKNPNGGGLILLPDNPGLTDPIGPSPIIDDPRVY